MIGVVNGQIHFTPFSNAIKHNPEVNPELLKIVEILSL
jgi:6-phosphofructokinase 1